MKKSIRLALLFVSLLLFFIITPFVVLYAIGYRLSPLEGQAQPVGVLLLETIPRRADVYIDNTFIGRTPRAVPNIPPGTTNVSLRKDGYVSWEKAVPIEATLTSEFRHIRLFPQHLATQLLRDSVRLFAISPNERLIAVAEKNTSVAVITSSGEIIVPAHTLAFAPQELRWSPDSTKLLAISSRHAALLDISQPPLPALDIPGVTAGAIVGWDADQPGRILYQAPKTGLMVYAVASRSSLPLAPLRLGTTTANGIIGINFASGALEQYSFSGQRQAILLEAAPVTTARIIAAGKNAVALLSSSGQLNLVAGGKLVEAAQNVTQAAWSPDGTLLAMQTAPNELHVSNVSSDSTPYLPLGEQSLVLRLSRPISQFSWYGSNHILYQTGDEITITETDTRDHAIQYKVDTTNIGRSLPAATKEGDTVYYLKQTAKGTALVSANLLPE